MDSLRSGRGSEAGFSLVEALIGLGLLGILFLFGSRTLYLAEFWRGKADSDHRVVLAKVDILQMIDCNTSVSDSSRGGKAVPQCDFDPNTCNASNQAKIRNDNFMPLLSKRKEADGRRATLIGTWKPIPLKGPSLTSAHGKLLDIRAGCGCCEKCVNGKGVFVEYRRLSPAPEPLDKYKPMFDGLPLSCVVP